VCLLKYAKAMPRKAAGKTIYHSLMKPRWRCGLCAACSGCSLCSAVCPLCSEVFAECSWRA